MSVQHSIGKGRLVSDTGKPTKIGNYEVIKLLEMYLKVVRQYQNRTRKFTVIQKGTLLELIIEIVDGDPIHIIKDLEKIVAEKNENCGFSP